MASWNKIFPLNIKYYIFGWYYSIYSGESAFQLFFFLQMNSKSEPESQFHHDLNQKQENMINYKLCILLEDFNRVADIELVTHKTELNRYLPWQLTKHFQTPVTGVMIVSAQSQVPGARSHGSWLSIFRHLGQEACYWLCTLGSLGKGVKAAV